MSVICRLAVLVVLGLASWLFVGVDEAQACTPNGDRMWINCADAGEAASVVSGVIYAPIADCNPRNERLEVSGYTVFKFVTVGGDGTTSVCGLVYPQERGVAQARFLESCSSRQSQTTQFLPVSGSKGCQRGCEVVYSQNVDETSTRSPTGNVCADDILKKNCPSGSYWNGYMGVCEPVQKSCPEDQEEVNGVCQPKNKCPNGMVAVQGSTPGAVQQGSLYCKPAENECPAGNVKSPSGQCLPGDGQCAAGEARGKDGTCKRDSNNDGVADSEEGPDDPNKDSASGGDSCDSPPTCNGNPVQCMQLKVQWRIDCNTRRNVNVSGGTCDAVPICTGKGCNAMEYAQLMQQWRATCALEKLAKAGGGGSGEGDTDANGNGVPDALEGSGDVAEPGDGAADIAASKKFGVGVSTNLLNTENLFGGGSCPEPPSFQLMGQNISGSDFPYWCQAMFLLSILIPLWGAFTAVKILMGWGGT